MRFCKSSSQRLPFGIFGICSLLLAASSARAQCGAGVVGFNGVGVASGNPFHAETVTTRTGLPKSEPDRIFRESIARDGHGRIRMERAAGEFKRQSGPDAGNKVADHRVTICDPVAQTLTRIDTMDETAEIIRSRSSAPRSPMQHSFCDIQTNLRATPSQTVQDLGNRAIESVEAHGVLVTHKVLAGSGEAGVSMGEPTTEIWCSEELSAVVLQISANTANPLKITREMKNVERAEPDPALFEIPPNYSVSESVESGPMHFQDGKATE